MQVSSVGWTAGEWRSTGRDIGGVAEGCVANCEVRDAGGLAVGGARQPTTIGRKRSASGRPEAPSSAAPTQQIADENAGEAPGGASPSDVRTKHLACSPTADSRTRKHYALQHITVLLPLNLLSEIPGPPRESSPRRRESAGMGAVNETGCKDQSPINRSIPTASQFLTES